MIILFLLYLVCALTFTVSKFSLLSLDPFFYLSIRMFFAGTFFYILDRIHSDKTKNNKINHFEIKGLFKNARFFWTIFISFFLSNMLDILSLSSLPSWVSALVYSLSPLATALIAQKVLYKKPNRIIGILIACSGSIFYQVVSYFSKGQCFSYISLAICFFAMFFGSKLWVDIENNSKFIKGRFNQLLAYLNLFSSIIFFFIWIMWGSSVEVHTVTNQLIYIFMIVMLSNVLFARLYTSALSKYNSVVVSLAGCLCPFYVLLLGIFFLGESCASYEVFFSGLGMCAIGLLIFFKQELSRSLEN